MPDVSQATKLPRRRPTKSKVIGPWLIGRTIGKGSSGHVRIARHVTTGEYAAVKIVSKHALISSRMSMSGAGEQEDKILLAIEREIVIMKLIDHPNILSLYDVWETKSELYLIMEYVQGGELFDYLVQKGRLPVEESLHYFQQIISAVDYCHRFNIAHRDLKPENLLLDADKNIKVADFGMAAWEGGESLLRTSCGSPHYASPEVVAGEAYQGSVSDIWSCGVILYALLAGRLPFDDDNIRVLLDKVKDGRFSMPNGIEPAAEDLLHKMLEKDASKRITMAEIQRHPFYRSRPARPVKGVLIPPPNLEGVERPVNSVEEIDPDIFRNLQTLWYGVSEEEIIDGLTNSKKTWEKAVYHLLSKYRLKQLENYNMGEEERAAALQEHGSQQVPASRVDPLARPSSTPAPRLLTSSALLGQNTTWLPARPDAPTPRRAVEHPGLTTHRRSAAQESSPIPVSPPVATLEEKGGYNAYDQQSIPPRRASGNSASSTSPKTESTFAPLQPITVPQMEDERMQNFFQQVVDYLNAMQSRQGALGAGVEHSGVSPVMQMLASTALGTPNSRVAACSPNSLFPPTPLIQNRGAAEANSMNTHLNERPHASYDTGGQPSPNLSHLPLNHGLGISHLGRKGDGQPPVKFPSQRRPTLDHGLPSGISQTGTKAVRRPGKGDLSTRGASYTSENSSDKENGQASVRQGRDPYSPSTIPQVLSEGNRHQDQHQDQQTQVAFNKASAPQHKQFARPDAALQRRFTLGERRVQIVEPVDDLDWMASKLKKRRSVQEPPSDSPIFSDGGFSPTIASSFESGSGFKSIFPAVASTQTQGHSKRSWFTTLFSFKPASYNLLSMYDLHATREECKRLLGSFGVIVVAQDTEGYGGGILKCRLDEVRDPAGAMSVIKAVRFRVEFQGGGTSSHLAAGYITSLSLVQEKGALSSFKLIFNRLRREWGLDSPGVGYDLNDRQNTRTNPTLRLVPYL